MTGSEEDQKTVRGTVFPTNVEADRAGDPEAAQGSPGAGRDGGDLLPKWNTDGGTALLVGDLALTVPLTAGAELELTAGLGENFGGPEGGTLLNSASASLSTSGFFRRGDRLTLMLGFPVAVSRGSTSIKLPVQTLSGSIEQRPIEIDLAPDDREMRLGIEYRYAFGKHSEIVLSAAYANNHGHFQRTLLTATGITLFTSRIYAARGRFPEACTMPLSCSNRLNDGFQECGSAILRLRRIFACRPTCMRGTPGLPIDCFRRMREIMPGVTPSR